MTQFDSKLIAQARKTKGYLLKKSNSPFSGWKKKYFIFIEQSLCIFKDQTLQSLQKSINFSQITLLNPYDKLDIEIRTGKKVYLLRADSPSDQDLWIASINILKEHHHEQSKSPKKNPSSSQSLQKHVTSSIKSSQSLSFNSKSNSSSKREISSEKIIYLLREKELSKFLGLFQLQKLSAVTKDERFLSRILFIEDKKNGIYFSLASKSIYPIIDGQLVKQDFIYPYQLNVLYFLPINIYKTALQVKDLKKNSCRLIQICKCSQILQSTMINISTIRLQIHCKKPVEIQVKHLSEVYANNLLDCVRKLAEVGHEYWNPKGKLLKNIDQFVVKFEENDENELIFYKMVQNQFDNALNIKINPEKREIDIYFHKVDSITNNMKNFIDACQIKTPPLNYLKEKYVKLYHKFVYNFLSKNWNFVYKLAAEDELISYSKRVFAYFQALNPVHHDVRVKEGCKTLLKITLKNYHNAIKQLAQNFSNTEEQSLRILKKVQFEKDGQTISDSIFFNTFCNNFFSILSLQFKSLAQIPKSDQFAKMSWLSMIQIFKTALQKLSMIAQICKQKTSLISISNSLKVLKNKKVPQIFFELQKTLLWNYKKQRQDFLRQINYQISLIETFCVKKLFVITFSSIDKDILKHEIKSMDFNKICTIVIQQISRLEHILPEVRVAMFEAAFEEVCYFFYICVVKYDNKTLSKDQCLGMINQKMTAIKDLFSPNVDEQKVMFLLKDLNLLKQFITCPITIIKVITRDLKKVFGSNFTQLHLKNLISLRVNSLKQKQLLFQECREQIKSSYNSTDEMQSIQRQSFFNSSYRRERVSTLTQSLKSYCEQFQKVESKSKKQRTILFGFQNSIKQGYLLRKKVIKNYNTTYTKFFYCLKKGKLFQHDNEHSEDILNCYLLGQLKKCYIEPEKNNCIHLQFEREILKFKASDFQQASDWIQKILEAMQEQKSLLTDIEGNGDEEGGLFEDLEKKVTFQTKETNEASSPKQKQKGKFKRNFSSQQKVSRISPKKTQKIQPNMMKKTNMSPSKLRVQNYPAKNKIQEKPKPKKDKSKGCGAGCNLF